MNILYLLLHTLIGLDKEEESRNRLIETKKPNTKNQSIYTMDDTLLPSVKNISREVLYEGFVSIDSILFLIEINKLKPSNLEKFVNETVFEAKRLLLKDVNVFNSFINFSSKVDTNNKELKNLIEKRNKILDSDKSQIALILTKDKLQSLRKRITTKLLLFDDKKENDYLRIINDLSNSRYGEDGVAVNLAKERFEFYRENVSLSDKEINDAKISFNLGGAIISPSILVQLVRKITMPEKREIVKKTLVAIFESLKVLKKNIINRSFMDKKKEIINYLINCLEIRIGQYRESIDNAYYQRSKLIGHFINENMNGNDLYRVLDRLQEKEIKKLIYIFENLNENQLGDCFVNDISIIEKYLNFICDGQVSSKKKLIDSLKYNSLDVTQI